MRPLKKWNARLGVGHVLLLGAIVLACVFLWISVIAPYCSTLLQPLQERSPFMHDILRNLLAVLLLPWTFGAFVVTLYVFQLRWDKTHSQQADSPSGGPAGPLGNSGVSDRPPPMS